MANTSPSGQVLIDAINEFSLGMNSGLQPYLLKKNQLAFALNATVRGGLATNRPPVNKMQMVWDSTDTKNNFQRGLFQGACYYRPDSGPECIVASISGRLYKIAIEGPVATVTDVTIPGDPNPASSTQAWLWQSEKWVIVQDGSSLPIFFDGSVSRRSNGPSHEIVSVTIPATGPNAVTPLVGGTIGPLTITPAGTIPDFYAGQIVLFNGAFYQITGPELKHMVVLVRVFDQSIDDFPAGTEIVIQPSLAGYITSQVIHSGSSGDVLPNTYNFTFNVSATDDIKAGTLLTIGDIVWKVTGFTSTQVTVTNAHTLFHSPVNKTAFAYPIATAVYFTAATDPNTLVSTLSDTTSYNDLVDPDGVEMTSQYSGKQGQIVYILGGQYRIYTGIEDTIPESSTTVTLTNLSDSEGVALTDGLSSEVMEIFSVPELPAGRMGAYGMGQNWMSLTDGLSFICSDICRGPSGTVEHDYRDSVLKTTDVTFLGGAFQIPQSGSHITSMVFVPKLDTALGQGPLQIGTTDGFFSINAPFIFGQEVEGVILPETLRGLGPVGQNSTVLVNSDTFFRSTQSIGSMVMGRRDFQTSWGNSNASTEVNERVLQHDKQALLQYGTGAVFDNRMFMACAPQESNGGVFHRGAVVINLDPSSNLTNKAAPVYDGLWTGLNVLQFVVGQFAGVNRLFAFGLNVTTSRIELYEQLPSLGHPFDNNSIPIVWGFETASLFNADVKPQDQTVRLIDGEFAVDDVIGQVDFKVWYRFDQGCWQDWHEFSICAEPAGNPQTYPALGLGSPKTDPNNYVSGTIATEGHLLQVKFQITGHCRFLRGRFKTVTTPSAEFTPPLCGDMVVVGEGSTASGPITSEKSIVTVTGPQGPAGPTGPQGPAGTDGADGADGATGPAWVPTHSDLTIASPTVIDMTSDYYRTATLTGDITFSTSNRAAARTVSIRIIAGASSRNLTFPSWTFLGAAAPTSIAANKIAILTITAFGTNDTDIIAAYSVQP